MKLLGERNWWAPAPLRRFHERYGLHEAPSHPGARHARPACCNRPAVGRPDAYVAQRFVIRSRASA